MINIRQLFQKYHIQFVDHGKNVGRGNINITCCWCGNADKSFHLAMREDTGYYFCFRNPRHKGQNVVSLLKRLSIPAKEYASLDLKEEDPSIYKDERNYSEWLYFEPAEENQEALDYLEERLFVDPVAICQKFNLRTSPEGQWAGRLLIPLTPVGWTGRAMREHFQLRYDAWTNEGSYFLFKQRSSSCILLEGGIDCMRIASVTSQFDVIGKCRMALSPAILAYLRDANYASIYHSPDASVSYSVSHTEKKLMQSYCTRTDVFSLVPPNGRKDFGITPETETRQLLSTLGAERMVI